MSLFRAAFKALGVRNVGDLESAADTLQLPDVIVSIAFIIASIELFRSMDTVFTQPEKVPTTRKKKNEAQQSQKSDTLGWDDIKDKLPLHFDPDLLGFGVSMQCLQIPNTASQPSQLLPVFGEAVSILIGELARIPMYDVPPTLRKTIINELQAQEYIGSR